MKYTTGIVATITLFAGIFLMGCDRPSNEMENAEISVIEADRDLEIAKSKVEAEIKMYRAENDDLIMEYNRTISEIKRKINNETDAETKVRLEKKLTEHEATHRELKREMDNYKASDRENWDDFKDSFSSRMNDLGDSLDDFFSTSGITATSRNQP